MALKAVLEVAGRVVGTPREALEAGFEARLIGSATMWPKILKERNFITHYGLFDQKI